MGQERRIEKVIVAASVDELLDPDLMPPNKPLLPTVRAASLRSAARPAADRQSVRLIVNVISNRSRKTCRYTTSKL